MQKKNDLLDFIEIVEIFISKTTYKLRLQIFLSVYWVFVNYTLYYANERFHGCNTCNFNSNHVFFLNNFLPVVVCFLVLLKYVIYIFSRKNNNFVFFHVVSLDLLHYLQVVQYWNDNIFICTIWDRKNGSHFFNAWLCWHLIEFISGFFHPIYYGRT